MNTPLKFDEEAKKILIAESSLHLPMLWAKLLTGPDLDVPVGFDGIDGYKNLIGYRGCKILEIGEHSYIGTTDLGEGDLSLISNLTRFEELFVEYLQDTWCVPIREDFTVKEYTSFNRFKRKEYMECFYSKSNRSPSSDFSGLMWRDIRKRTTKTSNLGFKMLVFEFLVVEPVL